MEYDRFDTSGAQNLAALDATTGVRTLDTDYVSLLMLSRPTTAYGQPPPSGIRHLRAATAFGLRPPWCNRWAFTDLGYSTAARGQPPPSGSCRLGQPPPSGSRCLWASAVLGHPPPAGSCRLRATAAIGRPPPTGVRCP